jgi:hypothetical protein
MNISDTGTFLICASILILTIVVSNLIIGKEDVVLREQHKRPWYLRLW